MSELVPHKVQVTAIDGRGRHEPDHFMERQSALYHKVSVVCLHVPIHIGIDESENDCFVSYQRLIVALGIADGLLIRSPIRCLPPDRRRMPVFIFLLLQYFDPEIRDIHRHAVIEPIATIGYFNRQPRHTADFLRNRHGMRINLVYQFVSQRQVCYRVIVLMTVVIVTVA